MSADHDVGEMLEAIEAHYSDRLTEWEVDFIESVTAQWAARQWISEKQRGVLETIFEKVSHGGRDSGHSRS